MIHIAFQQKDAEALTKSFEGDKYHHEEVVYIGDDFSIGPVYSAESAEGLARRKDWRNSFTEAHEENDVNPAVSAMEKIQTLQERLNAVPEESIWIWAAPNACDVCGYYLLVNFLKETMGQVSILWLNNLPFINEKGQVFYPERLSDIPSREFIKARQLARPVTPAEFETDGEEWTKLVDSGEMLRIAEGGKKVTGQEESYFDKEILKNLSTTPQKLQKLVHQMHSKSKGHPPPEYLLWRIHELAGAGTMICKGNIAQPRTIELSLPGAGSGEAAAGAPPTSEQKKEGHA